MGRDRYEKHKKGRLPPFVALLKGTLDAPAWKAMSHGARSLYVALKRKWGSDLHNNGRIYLSQRDAAEEIGSHHNEIARWYRELQHYGFVVMMTPGYLGVEGTGLAPHWRLTEVGYMKDPPTRDFARWDGTKFRDKKTKSRAGKGARGVPEMAHTIVLESRPLNPKTVLEMAHIDAADTVPEKAHISSIPLPSASAEQQLTPSPELADNLTRRRGAPAKRAVRKQLSAGP